MKFSKYTSALSTEGGRYHLQPEHAGLSTFLWLHVVVDMSRRNSKCTLHSCHVSRCRPLNLLSKTSHLFVLCHSAEEMFGENDPVSGEWTHGIFSSIWAKYNDLSKAQITWIICDGPVDAVWIENLNSAFSFLDFVCCHWRYVKIYLPSMSEILVSFCWLQMFSFCNVRSVLFVQALKLCSSNLNATSFLSFAVVVLSFLAVMVLTLKLLHSRVL